MKTTTTTMSKRDAVKARRERRRQFTLRKKQLRNIGAKSFDCVFVEDGKVRSDVDA